MIRNLPLYEKRLASLRSDKYQQTQGKLRDENGFCCLGVLCNEIDSEKWYRCAISGSYFYNGFWKHLSREIRLEIGLSDDEMNRLMVLNDGEGNSFEQIADYIENEILMEISKC